MIPNVIYYGWFGEKPKPPKIQACIDSWSRICPDYSVLELNEGNCNLRQNLWVAEAYKQGKWAYVADYFRFQYMYLYGGISLDADVELLKPLDSYLHHSFFSGQEIDGKVLITATMGSVPLHPFTRMVLDYYELAPFAPVPNTKFLTQLIRLFNFTVRPNRTIELPWGILYPQEVFCPFNHRTLTPLPTPRTVALHHFQGSWKST